MILQEEITYNDLVFIDNPLFTSLKNLKETGLFENPEQNLDFIKNLELYYSIEMKDVYNHMHSLELMEKGRETKLIDLEDFIKKE